MTVAVSENILTLDPLDQNCVPGAAVMDMVFDALVEDNHDGTFSPRLAESWEVSEDGLTYTFHLRDGVTAEDCGQAYVLGCAWLALAAMAANGVGSAPLKFTAGEVSVQEENGDGAQRASALRLQAETVLGPYLKDRGFLFQGVEG